MSSSVLNSVRSTFVAIFIATLLAVVARAQNSGLPPGPQVTPPPPVKEKSDAGAQADAQSRAQRRPRIGLVLEGGGALGLAHIGVIQWFEEHHIPVSYVAGTSMGGLVGGVYATGHSPKQIEQLINGIDWDKVIRGNSSFQDLTFRR